MRQCMHCVVLDVEGGVSIIPPVTVKVFHCIQTVQGVPAKLQAIEPLSPVGLHMRRLNPLIVWMKEPFKNFLAPPASRAKSSQGYPRLRPVFESFVLPALPLLLCFYALFISMV